MDEIASIIENKNLKAKDCRYHTIRSLENDGRIRALALKEDNKIHIEYTCPFCGNSSYMIQEWVDVSKAARIKFKFRCEKCDKLIKIEKLKSKKKEKR